MTRLRQIVCGCSGVTWTAATPLPPDMQSAQPRAVVLPNGALLLTAGRPGVDLFVSHDGFGRTWSRYSLPTFHNQLVGVQKEDPEWKFCSAYEAAAANHTFQNDAHHGWSQSDGCEFAVLIFAQVGLF